MKKSLIWLSAAMLSTAAATAQADDIEGVIESIDAQNRTLTVQGITFHTQDSTDYDDGLNSFADLSQGQRVEIDFEYRDGRHMATEIELDD